VTLLHCCHLLLLLLLHAQPTRETKLTGVFEVFDSLDGGLVSFVAENPKCIISGGATSRADKIYKRVRASNFRGIWENTITIESAFTAPAVTAAVANGQHPPPAARQQAAAAAGGSMDIVPSSSSSSGNKRTLAERASAGDNNNNNNTVMAVNQLAAEFRRHMDENNKRHDETDKKMCDLMAQVSRLGNVLKCAVSVCNSITTAGNKEAYQAPTMANPEGPGPSARVEVVLVCPKGTASSASFNGSTAGPSILWTVHLMPFYALFVYSGPPRSHDDLGPTARWLLWYTLSTY
jgi:hypothetical protein